MIFPQIYFRISAHILFYSTLLLLVSPMYLLGVLNAIWVFTILFFFNINDMCNFALLRKIEMASNYKQMHMFQ